MEWAGLIVCVCITSFMIVDISCDIFTQKTLSRLVEFGASGIYDGFESS